MPRLRRVVNHTTSDGGRSDRRDPKGGNHRASVGGREGELLALAKEERQELEKEQLSLTTAAEGNIYQLQGVTGRRPCHCSATRRRSRIKGAKRW